MTIKDWMEVTSKASYVETKPIFDTYAMQGRYAEYDTPTPSSRLLEQIVSSGGAILTSLASYANEGSAHAVAIVKPRGYLKPYIYIPDEPEFDGSEFRCLTRDDIDNIDYREEFLVVRHP